MWCKNYFFEISFDSENKKFDIHFIVESSLDMAIWKYKREKFPNNWDRFFLTVHFYNIFKFFCTNVIKSQ